MHGHLFLPQTPQKTQFDRHVSFIIPGPLDVREHIKRNKITQNKKDASASSDIASIKATLHVSLIVCICKATMHVSLIVRGYKATMYACITHCTWM